VLDIQLWMMHCLLIYYRDHYACQNYWLQNCIFTCICMSCMLKFVATVYVTLYKKYCDIALILTSDYVHNKVVFNQL
jgi:hypothetical protein